MSYGPLKNVKPFGAEYMGTCPKCGLRAGMDADMVAGRVSVDCPECEYHETHKHPSVVDVGGGVEGEGSGM